MSSLELALHASGDRFLDPEPIGAGSSGLVFSVEDTRRGERVALKLLREVTAQSVMALKAEFRAAAEIFHPNLVVLHELFGSGGQWFFTMQWIDGQPIVPASSRLLDAPGSRSSAEAPGSATDLLPAEELRRQLVQLWSAIEAIHEAGFVHRDIKPSNILVDRAGHVTLLDFGLLRSSNPGSPATALGEGSRMSGSPLYAAPEQILGGAIGPAADWYGLGSVMYELLTGSPPYAFPAAELLSRKLRQDPPAPQTLRASLPEDLCELCMLLLRRNPEERPGAEEIFARLCPGSLPVARVSLRPGSRPPLPEIVGRSAVVTEADTRLRSPTAGSVLVLFEGPSGIGKTTVASEVLRLARERGALILQSRCHHLESVPFNGWDGIIDGLAELMAEQEQELRAFVDPELAELFPVLQGESLAEQHSPPEAGDPVERRQSAFRSLGKLLGHLTFGREVILFFDDLHWADQDSLRLLEDLLLGGGRVSLRAVATARPADFPQSPLQRVLTSSKLDPVLCTVPLGPLKLADAQSLLTGLPAETREFAAEIAEQAAGDPYLLQELARELSQEAPVHQSRPALGGGPTLEALVRRRLDRLTAEERTMVRVLSVLGRPIALQVVCSAARLEGTPTTAVAPLRAAGFVRVTWWEGSPQLEGYHYRILQAVAAMIPAQELPDLHRRLASALLEQPKPDAEAIALSLAASGQLIWAAQWAERTANEAKRTLAFARAAHWYEQAIEWGNSVGAERRELLVRLGAMAEAAGDGVRAAAAYREALALVSDTAGDRTIRLNLQRRTIHSLIMSGRQRASEDLLRELLSSLGRPLPSAGPSLLLRLGMARAALRTRGLQRRSNVGDPPEIDALDIATVSYLHFHPLLAWLFGTWQLRAALAGGNDVQLLRALSNELIFASANGLRGLRWSSQVLAFAERLAPQVKDDHAWAWFDYARSLHAVLLGRFSESLRFAEAAEKRFKSQCHGAYWELENLRRSYVGALQLEGDMALPEPSLKQWLRAAEERGDFDGMASHLTGLAYAACSHDRPGEALEMIARARSLVVDPEGDLTLSIDWGEAFVLTYLEPDPEKLKGSYERLSSLRHKPQRFVQFFRIWKGGYAVRVATALAIHCDREERPRWRRALEHERAELERERTELSAFMVSQVNVAQAYLDGDVERTARLLHRRAAHAAERGMPLFQAALSYAAAALRGDSVEREVAAQSLRALRVVNVPAMVRAHTALPLDISG